MKIKQIFENKKDFLELLLLADEEEKMIDKYLENGDMFALYDENLKGCCVVLKIYEKTIEIKNLAIY